MSQLLDIEFTVAIFMGMVSILLWKHKKANLFFETIEYISLIIATVDLLILIPFTIKFLG
jgi:hypothetical protein